MIFSLQKQNIENSLISEKTVFIADESKNDTIHEIQAAIYNHTDESKLADIVIAGKLQPFTNQVEKKLN